MLEIMLLIASAGLFGAFIIIASSLWATWAHNSHLKAYRRFKQRQQEFNELLMQFIDESWYWPIKVRPVFYVEIDRSAQILFAHAQIEITIVEGIEMEISPISSPNSQPERKFRLPIYINIISQHYLVLQLIAKYENHIGKARSILGELQSEHLKITRLQAKVKAKMQKISEGFNDIEIKLTTLKRLYPGVYQKLQWAYYGAQNCLFEAKNQIETAKEGTDDGLEYAIADTLHSIAEYFLEHIGIALDASKHSAWYELDQVNVALEISQKLLAIIIRNHTVQTWKKLVFIRSKFHALDEILRVASSSLSSFEEQRDLLEQHQKQLKNVIFDDFVKRAIAAEERCEIYWGNYHEGRNFWRAYLGDILLPSQRLEECRENYQPIVESVLQDGTPIKQSELPSINNILKDFIDEMSYIGEQIEFLTQEYERNYEADLQANKELAEGGIVYQTLSNLQKVVQDSSPDIQADYAEYRRIYEQYKQRANRKRWAEFPSLLTEINELITEIKEALAMHHQIIASLQTESEQLWTELTDVFGKLKLLRDKKPKIEWHWNTLFESYDILVKTYPKKSESYNILSQFLQEAGLVLEAANKDMHFINDSWNDFVELYNKTGKNLAEANSKLDGYISEQKKGWLAVWKLIEYSMIQYQNNYQALNIKWKKALNAETIQVAIDACNQIDLKVGSVQKEVRDLVLSTKSYQKELDGLHKFILEMYEMYKQEIPEGVAKKVHRHCKHAEEKSEFLQAKYHLEVARNCILEEVTSKPNLSVAVQGDLAVGDIHKPTTQIEKIQGTSGGQINIAGENISQTNPSNVDVDHAGY